MGYDSWKQRSPDDDLYRGSAWEFAAEAACTCRLAAVHPTDIDPPEMIVNRDCPVHGDGGHDPDEALERKREAAE